MIMHPGIIALLIGSFLSTILIIKTAFIATKVIIYWDIKSHSDLQLQLERQTYIQDTVLLFTFFFQICSFFLFLYTLDELHNLFSGAMCATGTLQAAPVGWYLIPLKIFILFLSSLWLVLNSIDRREETYPLVPLKSILVLVFLPLITGDLLLSLLFFLRLDPAIITSCCGALFSDSASGMLGDLSAMPAAKMMIVFFSSGVILGGLILVSLYYRGHFLKKLLSLFSLFYFIISILSIISFISLYIYETPTHHCPFDMLQSQNYYIGYLLYFSLYTAVFTAFLPGFLLIIEQKYQLSNRLDDWLRLSLRLALASLFLFNAVASWPVLFGDFTLFY